LHQRKSVWLDRSVVVLKVAVGLITLPIHTFWPNVYVLSPLAYMLLLLIGLTVGINGFIQSQRAQVQDGKLLSAWCLMGMIFWLYDWLLQNNHIGIEGIYMGPYTNALAFLLFIYIMFRRYVGAISEVTQANTHLEQRLRQRESELDQIHLIQRHIEHQQTLANERQRIMQDMHDGLGSTLRTTLLAVEKGQLEQSHVSDLLKDCIDDLKLTIDAMEPVQADLLLVLATLRYRLGPRLESAGITLRWEIENVPALDWLDPRNALHILRILQEAFTNIIKHTHATEIRVATNIVDDSVIVSITDNGAGFDVVRGLASGGKGLGNQLRRAESIGADIHWEPVPAGTCFMLRLPIKR
jgi:signal transduction histidine kinase